MNSAVVGEVVQAWRALDGPSRASLRTGWPALAEALNDLATAGAVTRAGPWSRPVGKSTRESV